MYSAAAVANAFLDIARQDGKKLTNMKLQKLVYIAHGWHLALFGDPLIYDDVYAWQWGPVIPPLYEHLRQYGSGVVSELIRDSSTPVDPASREMHLIKAIWQKYGGMSAIQLSGITHQPNTPWSDAWRTWQYSKISDSRIKEHYQRLRHVRAVKQQ
jgi:uncharacterized phage-associated protein